MNILKLSFLTFLIAINFIGIEANAYDDEFAHPQLSLSAAKDSKIDAYLKNSFGTQFSKGINSLINGVRVIDWLTKGSEDEDKEACRRASHMHDPTKDWSISYMTDDPGRELVMAACQNWGRYSNITWATSFLQSVPEDLTAELKQTFTTNTDIAPYTWDKARLEYYNALISTTNNREYYFANSFLTIGHVLHLLQDVSVPAHTRNDMMSHLLVFDPLYFAFTYKVIAQPYEHYVKNLMEKNKTEYLDPAGNYPTFASQTVTKFWDTNDYDKTNPSASTIIGLSEYSNANFLSDWTIFKSPEEDSYHSYPYPAWSSVQEYEETIFPLPVIKKTYFKKISDGETVNHLAAAKWYYKNLPSSKKHWGLQLDDKCHEDYARKLLPRAVGYSAGLLDYFFRGNIEISLPGNGVYSKINSSEGEFNYLKLFAKNITENNEEMNDGSIELVVKYKLAQTDPFQSNPVTTSPIFIYYVVPEANNIRSIPRDNPVQLSFDLSGGNGISLWATDLSIQLVYHGKLGNEEGAVAVGFKDISEPTPIDIYNNMDKICLNGSWYTAGSDTAKEKAPGWDVYSHDMQNINIKVSSILTPSEASPTNTDRKVELLEPGNLARSMYVLGDYQDTPYDFKFSYSIYRELIPADQNDLYIHQPGSFPFSGNTIKNQTDYNVQIQEECDKVDAEVPCDITYYPLFYQFRGKDMWGPAGVIFDNPEYPVDLHCNWGDL